MSSSRRPRLALHMWQAALLKPVLNGVSAHGHNPTAGGVTPPSVKGEDTDTLENALTHPRSDAQSLLEPQLRLKSVAKIHLCSARPEVTNRTPVSLMWSLNIHLEIQLSCFSSKISEDLATVGQNNNNNKMAPLWTHSFPVHSIYFLKVFNSWIYLGLQPLHHNLCAILYFRTEFPQSTCNQNSNSHRPSSLMREAENWEAPSACVSTGDRTLELVETPATSPQSLVLCCQLFSSARQSLRCWAGRTVTIPLGKGQSIA